jgi:membrane protease YdiL (CAAX protease family)
MASLAITLNVGRELELSVSDVWRRWLGSYAFEFPATPLFEELVFRGVVFSELLWLFAAGSERPGDSLAQRSLKRWRAAWSANVLASLVFVGAHWPYWIYQEGIGATLAYRSVPILLLSLVLGMLFARASSIWPCVLLHWINNELSGLLPFS